MKNSALTKAVLAICAGLIFVQTLTARPNEGKSNATGTPGGAQALTPEQTAQLAEARSLTDSAVKLYGAGKYEEALPPARRALEIRERVLGAEHTLVANAINNLAAIYEGLKKRDEAAKHYERLLEIYEKKFETDDLRISRVLDRLAPLRLPEEHDKAEKYFQRSLAIKEKKLGAEHVEVARSLFALAEYYHLLQVERKAAPLYQRALEIGEKKLGPEHPDVTAILDRYTCLLRKSERYEELKAISERRRKQYGESSQKPKPIILGPDTEKEGVVHGKPLSTPQPDYPDALGKLRIGGKVIVEVTIDETGKVIRACALHGQRLLWNASEEAAYRAKYSPTLLSGQPVKAIGVITYNYVP